MKGRFKFHDAFAVVLADADFGGEGAGCEFLPQPRGLLAGAQVRLHLGRQPGDLALHGEV